MRRLAVLAIALVLAACQSHYAQVDALRRPAGGARILLMPPDIELYEIGAFGAAEPRAEWSEAAEKNLVAALREEKTARGLALVAYDPASLLAEQADEVNQLEKLHAVVGRAILDHHYAPIRSLPSRQGKIDYSLGPEARKLKPAGGADYALFVFIRDTYSSLGRRLMQVAMLGFFGAPSPGGQQLGFASLVDLETGDIVWYNRLLRDFGDMRSPEAARVTAKELLAGLPK